MAREWQGRAVEGRVKKSEEKIDLTMVQGEQNVELQ